jgi:uncharacterized protein
MHKQIGKIGMVVIVLMCSVSRQAVNAASFDCQKAATPIEKAICANADLNLADEQMGDLYRAIRDVANEQEAALLKTEQRQWLTERIENCTDLAPACLLNLYQHRLDDFDVRLRALRDHQFPETLVYLVPHEIQMVDPNAKDGWSSGTAEDCFSAQLQNDNELAFTYFSITTNAHTCQLDGTATREGAEFIWKSDEQDVTCTLHFELQDGVLQIKHDESTDCTYYCGARAAVETSLTLRPVQLTHASGCME